MQYTIEAVAGNPREYETKFGAMRSYKLKLSGESDPVEIGQKLSTPAPVVGDVLNGTIEDGQYGKKFKKEFNQGGFGGGATSGGGAARAGKSNFDNFTMYLSYAKDLVVAAMNNGATISPEKALELTINGGHELYNSRPDAPINEKPKAGDAEPNKDVNDFFKGTDIEMPEDFLK